MRGTDHDDVALLDAAPKRLKDDAAGPATVEPGTGETTTVEPAADEAQKPLVILLQGPVGPFFRRLQRDLERHGYRTLRLNFNAGDWIYAGGRRQRNYRGTPADWPEFFADLIDHEKPAHIILIGSRRPVHISAIEVANARGVPVWCLEEGYIRPDFVTVELGGNNGDSPLVTHPALATETFERSRPVTPVGPTFPVMAMHAFVYFSALFLGRAFFPTYRHHRERSGLVEMLMWCRNAVRKYTGMPRNFATMQRIMEHLDGQYFLAAMQVHDDLQLVHFGKGYTNGRFIVDTIRSFEENAPRHMHLVFKVHPLDRGHASYRRLIEEVARNVGAADRVHVLEDGSLGLLVRHSAGMVTINSTSGFSALHHRKPLMALGKALYTRPGLGVAAQSIADLDRFWSKPEAPDPAVWQRFLAEMKARSLVNGSFYVRRHAQAVAAGIVGRLRDHEALAEAAARAASAPALEPPAAAAALPGVAQFDPAVARLTARAAAPVPPSGAEIVALAPRRRA